jgi:hypothetical protein
MVCGGRDGLPAKVERIFRISPGGTASEMEGLRLPAHVSRTRQHARPSAIKIGAAHKKKFEEWLRATFAAEGHCRALAVGAANPAVARWIVRGRPAASRSRLHGNRRARRRLP